MIHVSISNIDTIVPLDNGNVGVSLKDGGFHMTSSTITFNFIEGTASFKNE